jgi:hypothetical protein
MPATYEPIATQTLGSAASSITFSSIPSTYTDLRVVLSAITTSGSNINMQLNGDTSALYSRTTLTGDGSSGSSVRASGDTRIYIGYSYGSPQRMMINVDVFSYAGSTFKTCLSSSSSDNNGTGLVQYGVGLYRSTTAITSLSLLTATNTFAVGTTATLYGIKNA